MTKHLKLTGLFLLLALLGLALVTGCGGGSSSGGGGGTPAGNLTFSGTIMDTNNDRLPGVGVSMTSRGGLRLPLIDSGTRAAFSATTDENGNFTLTGLTAGNYTFSVLPSGGLIFAQVDTGGQVSQSVTGAEIQVFADEDQWDEVVNNDESHPYDAQDGYVMVDAQSASEYSLSQVSMNTSTGGGYGSVGYFAENPRDADSVVDWSLTQTTEAGRGLFYAVTPGSHIIQAQREGYSFTNQSVTAVAGHINMIFMEGTSTTTYRVGGVLTETDNSTPVAGVTVELTSRSRNWFKSPKRYIVTTNAQGEYVFNGVAAGNYNIRYSKTNYVPLNALVAVSSNLDHLGAVLVQTAQWDAVMGDATHPYNANYGYVMVQARRADNGSSVPGVVIATSQGGTRGYVQDTVPVTISFAAGSTSNTGMAFFYNTGLTSHTFSATKTGYTFSNVSGVIPVAGEIVMTPIIATAYPSGYSLSGNIKAIDGEAISDATVTVVGSGRSALTDAQGAFTVSGISEDSYIVRVTKTDYLPTRTRLDIDRDLTGREYPLQRTAAFDGYHDTNVKMLMVRSLRASTQLPLPGCVSSCDGDYNDLGVFPGEVTTLDFLLSNRTYANGYTLFYDVTELPKGPINYTTTKTGYTFDNGAVDADDLEAGEIYYAANQGYGPETFTVSGVVQDASGNPGAYLTVDLLNDPDIHTQTDENGLFTLDNVPYGTQVFRVNHDFNLTDHVKCDTYVEVTEDIAYNPNSNNLQLMCFTRNEFNAMLQGSGQHPEYSYSPVGAQGYMAIMGRQANDEGNIPKLIMGDSGEWTAQGYLDESMAVDWSAAYAYSKQPVAVFYEGEPGTHTVGVERSVHSLNWIFPGESSVEVFAGEVTIKEIDALNYPLSGFSGEIDRYWSTGIAGVTVTAQRHYDSSLPSLYTTTTDAQGRFLFNSNLPSNGSQTFGLNLPGGYLPSRVVTSLYDFVHDVSLFGFNGSGDFNAWANTPDTGHPYNASNTYYAANYLNENGQGITLVTAVFDPNAPSLGYHDDAGVIDWSAGSTISNGLALGYGFTANNSVRVTGTHAALNFEELWAYGEAGEIVQVLVQALTHP